MLSLVFVLSTAVFASGEESGSEVTQSQKNGMISMLSSMEAHKEAVGLDGVNFYDLKVGNPVHAYHYIGNQFVEGYQLYPLTEGDDLVAWAIPIGDKYQITTSLAGKVNGQVSWNEPFALVYNRSHGYLYSGGQFTVLTEFEEETSRSVLPVEGQTMAAGVSAPVLETTALAESVPLGYTPALVPHAANATVMCGITPVCQKPYDKICWAASVACIVNYCEDTSYSAVDVASYHYESSNPSVFNKGVDYRLIPSLFADYGLLYTYGNAPSDNIILKNLNADYPIYARFIPLSGNGGHACVIYGINTSAGYVYVMNPSYDLDYQTNPEAASPYSTAVYDAGEGGYTFVSNDTGSTFVLAKGVCRYW